MSIIQLTYFQMRIYGKHDKNLINLQYIIGGFD